MCQKFHGAAFSTFAEVKLEHLTFIKGESMLESYRADNGTVRKFCKCCGSSLIFESKYNRQSATIEVALSAFDELDHIAADAHIYTESAAKWLPLNDSLPKYKKYRE